MKKNLINLYRKLHKLGFLKEANLIKMASEELRQILNVLNDALIENGFSIIDVPKTKNINGREFLPLTHESLSRLFYYLSSSNPEISSIAKEFWEVYDNPTSFLDTISNYLDPDGKFQFFKNLMLNYKDKIYSYFESNSKRLKFIFPQNEHVKLIDLIYKNIDNIDNMEDFKNILLPQISSLNFREDRRNYNNLVDSIFDFIHNGEELKLLISTLENLSTNSEQRTLEGKNISSILRTNFPIEILSKKMKQEEITDVSNNFKANLQNANSHNPIQLKNIYSYYVNNKIPNNQLDDIINILSSNIFTPSDILMDIYNNYPEYQRQILQNPSAPFNLVVEVATSNSPNSNFAKNNRNFIYYKNKLDSQNEVVSNQIGIDEDDLSF